MNEWTNKWESEWVERREWINEREWVNAWKMNDWMSKGVNWWTIEQLNEWMNEIYS
jgi:hypothetical protein